MRVTLRKRKTGAKTSLYLDIYHKGQRKQESLKLYLHQTNVGMRLSPQQKKEDKETLALANEIVSQRLSALRHNAHGVIDLSKQKISLEFYLKSLAEKRIDSAGNFGNWDSMLKHLSKFEKTKIQIGDVDKDWVESFRTYLVKDARTKSNQPLSQNSQSSYFNKMRAAFKQAVRDGILHRNPAEYVKGIKPGDPQREHLTKEEFIAVSKAECDIPMLKQAFLFSCLTGLRWSDINKLIWEEIRFNKEIGYHIRYTQQKTSSFEVLPICDILINCYLKKEDLIRRGYLRA